MMLLKKTVAISIALCGLFFFSVQNVQAKTLQAISDVTLHTATVEDEDGIATVSFTAVNNDSVPVALQYGLRAQDKSGDLIYEEVFAQTVLLPSQAREITKLQTTEPVVSTEPYDIFVIAKSDYGIVLALTGAGTINPVATPSTKESILPVVDNEVIIEECERVNDTQQFQCTFPNMQDNTDLEKYVLEYTVYTGSTYGSEIGAGQILFTSVQEKTIIVDVADIVNAAGKYEIQFRVKDVDNTFVTLSQKNLTFSVRGSWIALDVAEAKQIDEISMNVHARFDGSQRGTDRGFMYWILDEDDEICADDTMDVDSINPKDRELDVLLKPDCVSPRLVGVLYDGHDSSGYPVVISTVGSADFDKLIKLSQRERKSAELLNNSYAKNIAIAVVVFVIALISVSILNRSRNNSEPNIPSGVVGALLVPIVFMLGTQVVSAATFLSIDKNNIQFIVNLDQSTYMTDEEIGFSLGFIDLNTSAKPVGASIDVRVNGGATSTVVEASDIAMFYTDSVPGIATEGIHTLTFSSPGLCGSYFNISLFNIARWGIWDCEFEIDVTVDNTPDAPYPPSITSTETCATGTPFEMAVRSVHPLGLDLYYNIDWDSDSTIDERVPTSGYVAHDTPMPITHTWTDNVNLRAQAVDDVGAESTWSTHFAVCGPTVGGDPVLDISASPPLVEPDGSSTITWSTTDAYSCTVTGTNGASWIGDSGSNIVSNITEEITFTLSCVDFGGSPVGDSVKVRTTPVWQEF